MVATRSPLNGVDDQISSQEFILGWVLIVVAFGLVAILAGRFLGITGRAYHPCNGALGCVPFEFWVPGLGAPIGILAVAGYARSRGVAGRKLWLRLGALCLLTPLALGGILMLLLATFPLAVIPEFGLSELSKSLISLAMAVVVLSGGARVWVDSVPPHLLAVFAVWLAATLAISVPYASPSGGVLGTVAGGAGLSMMFVFVAAQPILAKSLRGLQPRLRYYGGSTLIIIGTLYLFLGVGGLLRWVVG